MSSESGNWLSQRLVIIAILLWESVAILSGCHGKISRFMGCLLSADTRGALCFILSDMGCRFGRVGWGGYWQRTCPQGRSMVFTAFVCSPSPDVFIGGGSVRQLWWDRLCSGFCAVLSWRYLAAAWLDVAAFLVRVRASQMH